MDKKYCLDRDRQQLQESQQRSEPTFFFKPETTDLPRVEIGPSFPRFHRSDPAVDLRTPSPPFTFHDHKQMFMKYAYAPSVPCFTPPRCRLAQAGSWTTPFSFPYPKIMQPPCLQDCSDSHDQWEPILTCSSLLYQLLLSLEDLAPCEESQPVLPQKAEPTLQENGSSDQTLSAPVEADPTCQDRNTTPALIEDSVSGHQTPAGLNQYWASANHSQESVEEPASCQPTSSEQIKDHVLGDKQPFAAIEDLASAHKTTTATNYQCVAGNQMPNEGMEELTWHPQIQGAPTVGLTSKEDRGKGNGSCFLAPWRAMWRRWKKSRKSAQLPTDKISQ
ncbi:uncharacterized protein LOC136719128 [Amia ocellicauda]|uniref:uncharacterized protein LOC136719128 n=1 Tax=Amia ocellicauda TaxID=2972642 RepID=UPI003464DA98